MITKYTAKLHYSFFQLLVSTTSLTRDNTFIYYNEFTRLEQPNLTSAISGGRTTLCVNKQGTPDTKLLLMAVVSDVSDTTRQKIGVGARYHCASVSTRKRCF